MTKFGTGPPTATSLFLCPWSGGILCTVSSPGAAPPHSGDGRRVLPAVMVTTTTTPSSSANGPERSPNAAKPCSTAERSGAEYRESRRNRVPQERSTVKPLLPVRLRCAPPQSCVPQLSEFSWLGVLRTTDTGRYAATGREIDFKMPAFPANCLTTFATTATFLTSGLGAGTPC